MPDETIQGYAVEIDRQTEGIGIVREKALSYRAIWRDTEFYRRCGRLPVPLWIVPTERRLEAVMRTWASVWPEGVWLIATDAALQQDVVEEWDGGVRRTCRLFDGWQLRPHELHQASAIRIDRHESRS